MATNYIIIDNTELNKVDFGQVNDISIETLRQSNDGLKSIIKWEQIEPDFISQLTTKSDIYTNEEILDILNEPEWYKQGFLDLDINI